MLQRIGWGIPSVLRCTLPQAYKAQKHLRLLGLCRMPQIIFLAFLNASVFKGGAEIIEKHDLDVRMRGELKGSALADVFEKIEAQKEKYNVSQYACFQTSLEQIFNGFATQQEDYDTQLPGAAASSN